MPDVKMYGIGYYMSNLGYGNGFERVEIRDLVAVFSSEFAAYSYADDNRLKSVICESYGNDRCFKKSSVLAKYESYELVVIDENENKNFVDFRD